MITAPIHHIILDERGVPYISGTTIKIACIAIDAETWGMTPRQIQENFPHLSLAQIHAALARYHDHQGELDAQIARETEEYERLRAENSNPLTREQFEERQRHATSQTG